MANWKMRKRLVGSVLGAWMVVAAAGIASAQGKLGPAAPVTYTNRYEGYVGLSLNNFQAGQYLNSHMNLGGIEIQGTDWLTHRFGAVLDLRMDAGTSPLVPNPYQNNRALVYRETGLAGVQVRGPKNQYAAVNLHALGGVSHGVFDDGVTVAPQEVGFYTNRTKPFFAVGGSLDYNVNAYMAIRLAPDLIFEHYGTSTREWVGVSGGLVYRFGQKQHRK